MYGNMTEDQKMIAEALEPIVTVIQQMLNKIQAMDEELDSLAKLVNEEIIGGITNLYNTKERLANVSCLKEKFLSVILYFSNNNTTISFIGILQIFDNSVVHVGIEDIICRKLDSGFVLQ